uniref:Large ribosomal subunit protein mL45 n=1 Tax=Saccoglossus kowalevskii TaxID=10224 RepID=A0ABM0MMK4_SACKO|nr:PREDICTED: 39S ribosomal protein L45, mitochondrial-like [Saccoglossus kowalevskii]
MAAAVFHRMGCRCPPTLQTALIQIHHKTLPAVCIPVRTRKTWVRAIPKNSKRTPWHMMSDEDKRKESWNITLERIDELMKQPTKSSYTDRQIIISCTGDIFQPYVPPEGDGKSTPLSTEGAKQRLERLKHVGFSTVDLRKIRKFDPEFNTKDFAKQAQHIFIKAHSALQDPTWFPIYENMHLSHDALLQDMVWGFKYKTVRWNWVESIEKPRVVHIRCTDMISKGNTYAQATVRFHSKQTLAIYDRFGRIMQGSETSPKDVLEYVVFEKHLMDKYGSWRIHGKIVPPWATHREPIIKTMVVPKTLDTVPEKSLEEKVEGASATATT